MKTSKACLPTRQGFTLIEILVVLAIIAVLAVVVMVNVTQYINKGKDSAMKDNMAVLMAISAVHFDDNANYDGFCDSTNALRVKDQLENNIKTTYFCNEKEDNSGFAACAYELNSSGDAWCIDNTGTKEQIDAEDCDATLVACP